MPRFGVQRTKLISVNAPSPEPSARPRSADVYIAITAVAAVTAAARRPRAQEENRVLLNHACEAAQFVKSLWLVAGVYVVVNF